MAISKAQRDALAQQDAPFLSRGLLADDPRSVQAHLRQAARLLADRQARSPSARLVTHIAELFDRSVPPAELAMLACRAGCSMCCYQPVAITAPEAFYLVAALQLRPEAVAAMEALAERAQDRSPDQAHVSWFACPLLDGEGNCSVYRARPLPCRNYVSINLADCKANYMLPGSATVMEPAGYGPLKDRCRMLLMAAMQIHGLPLDLYEMNAAVAAASKIPHAEKRWLRGENIFGDLRTLTPLKPELENAIRWLAQNIAPTL